MAHQSNPEQADIDTTHSVSRPQIIADGAENPNEWTDYTGTSSSTEHGIQVKSPSLSPPATNDTVTETPSASSSITEPRIYKRIHRFLSRNFGSTNKSPLRPSCGSRRSHLEIHVLLHKLPIIHNNLILCSVPPKYLPLIYSPPCVNLRRFHIFKHPAAQANTILHCHSNTCGPVFPHPITAPVRVTSPIIFLLKNLLFPGKHL